MPDKLTVIRIKKEDGTYSNQIPIGGYAENIVYTDNKSVYDGLQEKYIKPNSGIPKTDLDESVQISLDAANNALLNSDIDDTLTISGKVADAKKIGDILNTKANINGYYEELTSGSADQLVSSVYNQDNIPYNFRTAGGSADIGNRLYNKVIGGTVVWNQLAANPSDWIQQTNSTSISVSNNIITATLVSDTGNAYRPAIKMSDKPQSIIGHKYFITFSLKANLTYSAYLSSSASVAVALRDKNDTINTWHDFSYFMSATKVGYIIDYIGLNNQSPVMYPEDIIQYKNIMIFDLTMMFGPAIADYIYNLEQTTAGAGEAWFRKLFPQPYYAHNSGELMSVNVSAHKMIGFNAYDPTTGTARLIGGNQYQITGTYTSVSYEYANGDTETLSIDNSGYFTPINNGILTVTGGNSTDTCVHLVWSGYRDDEYEDYVVYEYALDSNLTLRGIPKLNSSNNLYYDGDIYEANGMVTRKYDIRAYASGDETDGTTMITDGTNTVYKLDSVTTETADVYTKYQNCDDFGTEEYIDYAVLQGERDVAIPVGHETLYMINLRDRLQHLPDLAFSNGIYLIYQSNNEMSLIPYAAPTGLPPAPTTDGTYVLEATVSDGTVTYAWVSEQ